MRGNSISEFSFSASPAMYAATRLIIEGLASQGKKPLRTISMPIGGGTPSRSNPDYFTGQIPWITVADLKLRQFAPQPIVTAREFITEEALEHSAARLIPAGSVVLATRVSVGKVGIAQVPLATNQDFASFAPKAEINSRFLAYCLIASTGKMREATRGTTIKGIKREHLLNLELPFPDKIIQENVVRYLDAVSEKGAVYAENATSRDLPPIISTIPKTVARIEELAARIEEARELRRRAVEETEALLASIARLLFDANKNSMITIDELVGKKNLKNGLSVKTTNLESKIQCLRLSALRDGKINCLDSKPIPLDEKEISQYLVKTKDVFIVRGNGSKELVGRAGMVDKALPGVIFPDLFIRIPLNNSEVLPEFFVYWWNSKIMRDIIEETAKTTSGIWKINQGHIASFSFPHIGINEQGSIVAHLETLQSKIDLLRSHQAETAVELDALLPAVLERAFRGEL
jgi:type I restriction enzyme, S subunit